MYFVRKVNEFGATAPSLLRKYNIHTAGGTSPPKTQIPSNEIINTYTPTLFGVNIKAYCTYIYNITRYHNDMQYVCTLTPHDQTIQIVRSRLIFCVFIIINIFQLNNLMVHLRLGI